MKINTTNILLVTLIILTTFNILWVVPYVYRTFNLENFSSIFNNIVTPLATISAFVVYFLTLKHIRKQTDSLNEQNQLVIGEKVFEELTVKLDEFKKEHEKLYLSGDFRELSPRSSIDLVGLNFKNDFEILLKDGDYNNFIDGNITKEDYQKTHGFRQYQVSNILWGKLTSFIYDVEFFLDKIEKSNELHSSHKRRLVNYICSEVISEYLSFAGEKLAYDIVLLTQKEEQSTYFEALKIGRLSERIQKDYNGIYLENYSLT
jgi:hypothetical protein